MENESGSFEGQGKVQIAWRFNPVASAKGLVVIAHGVAEHMDRYEHVAQALHDAGYAVMRVDHRGHGASGGPRVFVKRFGEYVADLETVIALAKGKAPGGVKTFLLGHSMGGLIAVHHLLAHPGVVHGAILSAPALEFSIKVPAWKDALGKGMSAIWPGLAIPTGVDPAVVSRDPAVVKAYANDPRVTKKATARWYTEMLSAQSEAMARALEVKTPFLVLIGGQDKLASASAIERWFPQTGASDKTLLPYPALYHEVMNEPEKDVVLGDIRRWLDARA
ncbi:MAG: alpha/beta hydrolase [Myxococcota bacterium]